MEKSEKIYLASKAAQKGWGYETLKYGDDLYHLKGDERDNILDEIWDYVDEYKENGARYFREKYGEFKLY